MSPLLKSQPPSEPYEELTLEPSNRFSEGALLMQNMGYVLGQGLGK